MDGWVKAWRARAASRRAGAGARDRPGGLSAAARAASSPAAAGALFLLAAALSVTRVTDTDLYWHLASGDLIRSTGAVPRTEPFSYTVPGHRWIDIHWLFQAVLSFIAEKSGFTGLTILKAVLILGLMGLLYVRCRRHAGPNAVVALLLLVTIASQERFHMRPEIVSWILMALVLDALDRALAPAAGDRARRVILWIELPSLQIIWVNVQGLFMIGPALVGLLLLATASSWRRRPGALDRALDLLVCLALQAVASLVNPYGATALRLPFEELFSHLGGRTLLSRTIAEFRPPLSGYLVTPSIVAFVVLAAVAAASLAGDARSVRRFDLLVAIATFYVALKARRNVPIFAVAAAPIVARSLGRLEPRIASAARLVVEAWRGAPGWPQAGFLAAARRRAPFVASAALLLAGLGLTWSVVTNRFFLHPPTERWWGLGEIPYYFPEEGARFVIESRLPGHVFHPLAIGGYLIRAWGGKRRVFIDGRNDPYLDGVLESYLKAIGDPSAFEEIVRRYQITAVLWSPERALEAKPLLGYLARGEGWVLVHIDPGAVLYLRSDVPLPALLAEAPFRAGRDRAGVYGELVRKLEAEPFSGPPLREIALGETFSVTGDPKGAELFFRRALDRLPGGSAPVLHDYALALERQGRLAEARAAHEAALARDPGFLPSLGALGALLLEEGKVQDAAERIDAAYRGGERGTRVMIARARLFDRQGKPREAVAAYQEALAGAPRNVELLRDVGSFYARHDEPAAALDFYTRAASVDPGDSRTALEMTLLLDSLGRTTAALDVVRDAASRVIDSAALGRPVNEDDRQVVLLAARLETKTGSPERAARWIQGLARRAAQ
jgi:tetratricopeptide (TPR) repeat protein